MNRTARYKLGLWVTLFVGIGLIVSAFGALIHNKWERMKPDPIAEMGEHATLYDAKVELDAKRKRLTGSLDVHAKNDTGTKQEAIYFHVYPKQFKDNSALEGEDWVYTLGKTRIPGDIEVKDVEVNGASADWEIEGTVLKIQVGDDGWDQDEIVGIRMEFDLQTPKNNGRFSYDANAIWFGNWLPIRAVYDEDGWNLDPYYPIGDPFYSDTAKYKLQAKLPKGWKLATSAEDGEQEGRTVKVEIENVRDFAMVAMDDTYQSLTKTVGDVKVRTWYRDTDNKSHAARIHTSAYRSLAYFNNTYGEYPYGEYDVVRTGGFFGGMEYPGLVFIEGRNFDYGGIVSVVHETAHQWWYGMVGNDEVEEPWLDESLTSYSTARFLLDEYSDVGEDFLNTQYERVAKLAEIEGTGETLSMPVYDFHNWGSYGGLVYGKGMLMLYELEQTIGQPAMEYMLHQYWATYKDKNAKGEKLLDAIDRVLGDEIKFELDAWMSAPGAWPVETER